MMAPSDRAGGGDGSLDHDDFMTLHDRVRLRRGKRQDGGLSTRFVRALDRGVGTRTLPTAQDYTAATLTALRRLDDEAPQAALVVRRCCVDGLTEVQAASVLAMSKSTVHRVKGRALSQMSATARIDRERIRYELKRLDDACA